MKKRILLKPGFNDAAAKSEVLGWTEPIMNFLLWAIPIVAGIIILVQYMKWLQKPEHERDQQPFWSTTGMTLIKYTIIAELLPVLFKIFGLSQ